MGDVCLRPCTAPCGRVTCLKEEKFRCCLDFPRPRLATNTRRKQSLSFGLCTPRPSSLEVSLILWVRDVIHNTLDNVRAVSA